MKKPLLIATLGYPGSGKTYFSERLAKEYNLFHLNSDKVRHEIFSNPVFTPEEHRVVFGFINYLIEELLSLGVGVIVDANSNKRLHRNNFAKQAKKYNAKYILVHIQTPVELAERRLVKRRNIKSKEKQKFYRPIDVSVLHLLKNEIEIPTSKEPTILINGKKKFNEQLKEFELGLKLVN